MRIVDSTEAAPVPRRSLRDRLREAGRGLRDAFDSLSKWAAPRFVLSWVIWGAWRLWSLEYADQLLEDRPFYPSHTLVMLAVLAVDGAAWFLADTIFSVRGKHWQFVAHEVSVTAKDDAAEGGAR